MFLAGSENVFEQSIAVWKSRHHGHPKSNVEIFQWSVVSVLCPPISLLKRHARELKVVMIEEDHWISPNFPPFLWFCGGSMWVYIQS